MKEKKKKELPTRGFERASQLPPAKKVQPLTTGPCDRYIHFLWKLISLKYLIFYRSSGATLIKYQVNSSRVIMSVIVMTTPSYKAVILQGEIWCLSLLGFKRHLKSEFALSFKLYCVYFTSFNSTNVGDFFWIWILKDWIEVQQKRWKKIVVLCSRSQQNVKVVIV